MIKEESTNILYIVKLSTYKIRIMMNYYVFFKSRKRVNRKIEK